MLAIILIPVTISISGIALLNYMYTQPVGFGIDRRDTGQISDPACPRDHRPALGLDTPASAAHLGKYLGDDRYRRHSVRLFLRHLYADRGLVAILRLRVIPLSRYSGRGGVEPRAIAQPASPMTPREDPQMTSEPCPVCNQIRVRPAFSKDGLSYNRCGRCGFVFARPRINANLQSGIEDFDSAYLQYLGEDFADGKDHDCVVSWMRRLGFQNSQSLLDLGCGGGKFVRRLIREGINATGLEPSAALFDKFLKQDPAFELARVEEVSQRWAGAFDCVTAFDVIEHVEDPRSFLEHAARLLKQNGRLYLSTPDNASLASFVFGKSWHYYNRFHLSLLSPRSIRLLAQPSGLRWVACARVGRLALPGISHAIFFHVRFETHPPAICRSPERNRHSDQPL